MKKSLSVIFVAAVLTAGAAIASAKTFEQPMLGLSLDVPDDIENISISAITEDENDAIGVNISFVNTATMTPALEAYENALDFGDDAAQKKAREDYFAANDANTEDYGKVIGVPTADLETAKVACGITGNYNEIGVNGDYTYYIVKYDLNADAKLSDESRQLFESGKDAAYAILEGVKLIPIQGADSVSSISTFTTFDMNGNIVDASIFSKADVTVLNVWATNCNPCISEMPELSAWSKELPENVQIVGLLYDVISSSDKTFDRAQKIIEKSGVGFTNLLRSESLSGFLRTVKGTPVTFFFDKNGVALHEPVLDAKIDEYKAIVRGILGK